MRYLSVCSGIEAATVAWHDLGWSPVAFSEIEAFPGAVLRTHYPDVPNWGDMTRFQEWPDADVDLLVGGTPCQSFSVAGLRKGLADPRGNLALTYLAIVDRYRPRWVVWENVPGVLSSAGGRDFGAFLGGLGQLGYGWAYRVLDAQYFGVAQRRRRVFVVGCLGGWQRAAAVLFERHSLSGHPAPRREAGKGVTRSVGGGPENGRLAGAVTSKWAKGSGGPAGDECYNMIAHSIPAQQDSEDGTGRGVPVVPAQPYTLAIRGRADSYDLEFRQDGLANALLTPNGGRAGIGVGAVAHAFDARQSDVVQYGDMTGPLDTDGQSVGVMQSIAIRTANTGANGHGVALDVAHTLDQAQGQAVALIGGIDYQHNGHTAAEPIGPLLKGSPTGGGSPLHAVAFSSKDHGADAGEIAPTLRAMGHAGSHANGGGQIAVAFTQNTRDEVRYINGDGQIVGALAADAGMKQTNYSALPAVAFEPGSIARHAGPAGESYLAPTLRKEMGDNQPAVRVGMSVRRLTPRECERLQGFPDDYTLITYWKKPACDLLQGFPDDYTPITYRKKPAADGPRYKALGNSMAVPVMRWIGRRLQAVDGIKE